jgi:hypothetical protein
MLLGDYPVWPVRTVGYISDEWELELGLISGNWNQTETQFWNWNQNWTGSNSKNPNWNIVVIFFKELNLNRTWGSIFGWNENWNQNWNHFDCKP